MAKQVILSKPPANLQAFPRVDFLDVFDQFINAHGYNIGIEPAFSCPCKMRQHAQSSCLNCQGTGFVFGSKTQAKLA